MFFLIQATSVRKVNIFIFFIISIPCFPVIPAEVKGLSGRLFEGPIPTLLLEAWKREFTG